jgi:hypothetical protein
LRADLARWAKQLESAKPETRADVQKTLRLRQCHLDLVGLRDEKELADLPAAEYEAWQKLGAEVQALLQRAQGKE